MLQDENFSVMWLVLLCLVDWAASKEYPNCIHVYPTNKKKSWMLLQMYLIHIQVYLMCIGIQYVSGAGVKP